MGSTGSYFLSDEVHEGNVPFFQPCSTNNTIHEQNLEIFSLIWCDADVDNVYGSRVAQEKLVDLIHLQRTFKSIEECTTYILNETNIIDKIILISSGSFAQDLISRVHHIPQLHSIHIYCLLKKTY